MTYTTPPSGVPADGVAIRVGNSDGTQTPTESATILAIHAPAVIDFTVTSVVKGGTAVAAPQSEDLTALNPGDTVTFSFISSKWVSTVTSVAVLFCRSPQGELRQIGLGNAGNFCRVAVTGESSGTLSQTVANGGWQRTMTYTVPTGGLPPYGVFISAGDTSRFQGQAVPIIGAGTAPSVSVTPADRDSLSAGGTHTFTVSGANWTAGPSTSVWSMGSVYGEFCTVGSGGLDAITAADCSAAGRVTITVPASGSPLGTFSGVSMTYTVPDGGAPERGVAIRVRRDVNDLTLDLPHTLESAAALAVPAAIKPLISVAPVNRDTLSPGSTQTFSVTGTNWTDGPLTGVFCTIPDGGADAITTSDCDTANPVAITVTGGTFTVTMTYTVPDGGVPARGVAIRVSNSAGTETDTAVVVVAGRATIEVTPQTVDRNTLNAGDTPTFTVSGSSWTATELSAVFCTVPSGGAAAVTASACPSTGAVTIPVSGGSFSVTMTYTVPSGGVPTNGVAIRVSDSDPDGNESAVAVVIAAAPPESGPRITVSPSLVDRSSLNAGDTRTFTVRGSGWTLAPFGAFCVIPPGGIDAAGRSDCDITYTVQVIRLGPGGTFSISITYTVPEDGIPERGVVIGFGDPTETEIAFQLVISAVPGADEEPPAVWVPTPEVDRADLEPGDEQDVEVAVSDLRTETVVVAVCRIPPGGVEEITAADCDLTTSVVESVTGGTTSVSVMHKVSEDGVPPEGVAVVVFDPDAAPPPAAALSLSVTAVSPAPIDRSLLEPGDRQVVMVSGAGWTSDSVSLAFCETAAGGDDCDWGAAVAASPTDGSFTVRMAYLVPAGGVPAGGVSVSALGVPAEVAETVRVIGIEAAGALGTETATAVVLPPETRPSISVSPPLVDRDDLDAGNRRRFTVSGTDWTGGPVPVVLCAAGSDGVDGVAGTGTGSVGDIGEDGSGGEDGAIGVDGATGEDGSGGCDESNAVTATPDRDGRFTVQVVYRVPDSGVPAYGVAVRAGPDNDGATDAVQVVEPLLSDGLRPLIAATIVAPLAPPTVSVSAVSPAPIDRSELEPGDRQLVVVSGANWTSEQVSVAFCEIGAGGLGRVSEGACDGAPTTAPQSSGIFAVRMHYTVPAGGLPEGGVAALVTGSDGEESGVAMVIEAAPQPSISVSPATVDRGTLGRGDSVEFTVTGTHWSVASLSGEFCETPEGGAAAISGAGCSGSGGAVDVTVADGGFTATMTYAVPASGLPAGGVSISFASADGAESAAAEVIAPQPPSGPWITVRPRSVDRAAATPGGKYVFEVTGGNWSLSVFGLFCAIPAGGIEAMGQTDCDISNITPITPDRDGNITATLTYTVPAGGPPFYGVAVAVGDPAQIETSEAVVIGAADPGTEPEPEIRTEPWISVEPESVDRTDAAPGSRHEFRLTGDNWTRNLLALFCTVPAAGADSISPTDCDIVNRVSITPDSDGSISATVAYTVPAGGPPGSGVAILVGDSAQIESAVLVVIAAAP